MDIENLDKEEKELIELLAHNLSEKKFVRALQLIAIDGKKYHQEQLKLLDIDNTSGIVYALLDEDNDIITIHKTTDGAVLKRTEILENKEYKKLAMFKLELME